MTNVGLASPLNCRSKLIHDDENTESRPVLLSFVSCIQTVKSSVDPLTILDHISHLDKSTIVTTI